MANSLPASIVGPTVDQIEWIISPHTIIVRVYGERQPLGVFIPIFQIRIRDVHFQALVSICTIRSAVPFT